MKTILVEFNGYWREVNKNCIPDKSGIYCVYRCVYVKPTIAGEKGTVSLKELIYIGEAINARERIGTHDRLEDWKKALKSGEVLCYSFAPVGSNDRERAEAALIYEHKPRFNTQCVDEFYYPETEIITKGKNEFLEEEFVVG